MTHLSTRNQTSVSDSEDDDDQEEPQEDDPKTPPVSRKLVNQMQESENTLDQLTEEERADFCQMEQDQAEHDDPIMG